MVGSKAAVLLVLHYLVKLLHCAEYHVKADFPSTCPTNATSCLTLSEYVQNTTTYFTSESTFYLLQGQHHLKEVLILSGVTNITFRGDDTGITTISGSTTLTNSAVITLKDSTLLEILNVEFNGEALMFAQGIKVMNSTANFTNCSFTNWHSHHNGGGIYVNGSNVTFLGTNNFTSNKANCDGGAIYMNASNVKFSGINTFTRNKAQFGGAICVNTSNVTFSNITIFTNNTVNVSQGGGFARGGGIFTYNSTVTLSGNSTFLENYSRWGGAGLYSDCSHITFTDFCTFQSNRASHGGAMYVRKSTVSLKSVQRSAEFNFTSNSAENSGGALVAVEGSNIDCQESNINVINNFARNGKCGGVYIVDSTMNTQANITFKNNSTPQGGGGMYAQDSTLGIKGNYSFLENKAKDGGGMVLQETDVGRGTTVILNSPVTMNFNGNRANRTGGGLLFINSHLCKVENGSCLFEIRRDNPNFTSEDVRLNFRDNFAGHAGSVLYGGFLQNCSTKVDDKQKDYNFLEKNNILNISNISHTETVSRFSSNPIKVCFCMSDTINCNRSTNKTVSPQVKFNLSVIALGQGSVPIPSTIHSQIQNSEGSTILPSHEIEGKCTNITFQLYDTSNTTLLLSPYKDDKCVQYSQAEMHVKFECPAGFNLIENQCECNNKLEKIINCTLTLKIKRKGNSWIDIVDKNTSSFVYYPECPLNYCNNHTSLDFSHSYDSNILCSPHREGTLCGACTKGYSLTLNKFNCKKCDNSNISLLLLFAFAGVAVIVILSALHMTVAAGTINGLILYANIVNVNRLIFLPTNRTHIYILTVFISWLNLDFGIGTCFYNGLNAYTYAWLEYVFPLYLWFLIGAIIISSRISAKVGKLFGSNPVAVLATVILMSYTKLLQAALVSLHYTSLKYSDERRSYRAWYYDANIPYFGNVQHISLAITALCMIGFLLLPYTFLLMFSYHLQALSRKRAFSWLNKIKPLLDAYYAPYRARTRYWPGLMLLVRGCLYTAFLVTDHRDNLIAISSVFTAVALMPWLGHRVYEKFYNEVLEASFILNICLLSAASSHVLAVGGKQEIVTYLSVTIAFLQFLGIVVFHLYLRFKNIKFLVLFKACLVKKSVLQPKEAKEDKPTNVQKVSMTVMDLREPLLESLQ